MAALPSLDTAMSRPPSGIASPPHRMPTSRSRTQSISSDRPSTIGHGFMSPPLSVSPEAAFIAASAASQIVTNDHDSHADAWFDQHGVEPSGETALVSPAALQLVNNFLDQLLFNFLSVSRSTSLSALRPAVSEVLKPKLAKDAINQADEELREYLGGGDDEDLLPSQDQVSPADWDLELVWKRTRLRCMVYSSLGDMEEEDEDFYMEQEHLDTGLEDRLSDVVSPAVAIFLTSILEFMGEQALVVAGQAAYHRMRVKYGKDLKDGVRSPSDIADRILVEELDMERVALDRTLGRLWRAWKKKIRSPGIGIGMDHALARTYSRESLRGSHLRSPSLTAEATVPATVREPPAEEPDQPVPEISAPEEVDAQDPSLDEYELAVSIPLPIRPRDVDEIEVPGLASYSDDEEDQADEGDGADEMLAPRPKSWMIFPSAAVDGPPTPTGSQPQTPIFATRKRSNSLPTPAATPYNSSPKHLKAEPSLATADRHSSDSISGATALLDKISSELPPQEHILETEETEKIEETVVISSSPAKSKGRNLAMALDSVAPVDGGLEVTVKSTAPEEDGDDEEPDEEVDEIDELVEEPQILTSSRISISGRSASPTMSEQGKPLTINANLPARTPSMHSLRLIEVSSPRSPVPRSRGSSVDPAEHVRAGTLSRTNSVRTPPIAEETSLAHPPTTAHPTTALHLSRSAGPANESISEAEEVANVSHGVSSRVPDTVTAEPLITPSPTDYYARAGNPEAIFGSATRTSSTAASPVKSSATKVTILSSSTTPGTFFIQDPPEESDVRPSRTRKGAPVQVSIPSPPPPAVPERSPSRQALASSPATGSPAGQPTSIGIVSVDRSRARTSSETSGPKGQESNSVGVTRPLHASGSSTSSARLKAMRTSEESSHTQADVVRNFEELIQSDQTIQYTLTPESMRDIETQPTRAMASGSPVVPVKSRKSEEARQPGERSRSSSFNNKPQSEVKRSTSISRSTGLHSHPINEDPANGVRSTALAGRPAPVVPSKPRINNPQARDARLPRESLADLAEFLRSTGPNGASPTSAAGGLGNGAVARVGGPTAVRSASGPVPVGSSLDSGRASTSSNPNRIRLQARGAAVDYKDDNSDLIDFIRRGPPAVAGGHRIPRNVAPFRTTMDSDQMSGAVGGRAVDAQIREVDARNSQASTNITESSFTSQSALLGRAKPTSGANSRFGGVDEADMPIPTRKTRRVRDPYAIDLSDEDDADEGEPTPRPSRRAPPQEESLADFLKNYSPPPEPAPVPQNQPKKKASAPSLMSRFGRRDNAPSGAGSVGAMGLRSPTKGVPESRSLNSRAGGGRGYIPIQVNIPSGADTYGTSTGYGQPSSSSQFASPNGNTGTAPGRRIPMKKFEPRDAVSVPSRGTSDLAAFLKNSEPPPAMMASGQLASPGDDNSGLSKVFSRRKKPSFA
ncbi:hypothetical protein GQ53DRAFT_756677 [Thozetella sp. PMI_491]|nr:hypothetical protein GQ53DRAFT_756677 [Thozetella sp. PMI_491]